MEPRPGWREGGALSESSPLELVRWWCAEPESGEGSGRVVIATVPGTRGRVAMLAVRALVVVVGAVVGRPPVMLLGGWWAVGSERRREMGAGGARPVDMVRLTLGRQSQASDVGDGLKAAMSGVRNGRRVQREGL